MKLKTFIATCWIILVTIATLPAGAASGSGFTPAEQAKIETAVGQAAKEGLFPEILYERINEGVARKVPFERIFAVIEQKNSEMRELKIFCAESKKSNMPVPWTQENAAQLLLARQNGLTGQDIYFYHQVLAAKINKANDFMDILKLASRAQKKGVSREFLKQYAAALADREAAVAEQRRYFALLANAGTELDDAQQKALLQAIIEGRNYRDIEQMFKRQKTEAGLDRQGRQQDDELRQRIHGASGRDNEQKGKERKR